MRGRQLDELVRRLGRAGLDLTAEELADAVWLALRIGPARPHQAPGRPGPAPAAPPGQPSDARPKPPVERGTDSAPQPVAGPPAGAVPLHIPGGTGHPHSDGGNAAFPVRAPAATALPGLLGLEKALRMLGRYRVTATAPPDDRIDEEATAERAAASGIVLPVPGAGRRHRCDIQLLMDTGPAMAVWGQMVEELRQACQQSGAFASVRVHHLYADASGAPVVGTTAGPGRRTRRRPPHELHDPSGRCLTFVISDCVGPLWQSGAAQRLLHDWPRASPLAVVQPLPPRLWGRTALPAEPGLLVRPAELGGRVGFLPDEEPWDGRATGARPVPVLQPTPEAIETWARLLSGTGPTSERAWAAWTVPGAAPLNPAPAAAAPRLDDDLLRAFRATASPGALRLAVYLAAAPLTLPVMQLVQRAMLPDTGPMELAEVLLGGLLRQLPGTDEQPCFAYPGRVQDLLLSSLDQDTAGLVLKHCSAYVERRFGKSTRNFAALAAARLADHDPASGPGPVTDDTGPQGAGGVETELFARIPARVLRFYLPDLVTPEPLAEAERLLGQWQSLADPEVLHRARQQAEAAVRGRAPAEDDGVRAHLVLGRVLRAEAGTASARAGGRRAHLLLAAVEALAAAHRAAPDDTVEQAAAALELAAARHEVWRLTGDRDQLTAALDVLAPGTPPWPAVTGREAYGPGAYGERQGGIEGDARPGERHGGGTGGEVPRHGGHGSGQDGGARGQDDGGQDRAHRDADRTGELWATAHRSRLLRRGRLLLDLGRPGESVPELREACALLDASNTSDAIRSPAFLDLARALRGAGADGAETREALLRAERAAGDDPDLRLPCLAARAAFHDATGEPREADEAYETAAMLAPADSLRRCDLLIAWGESLLRRASRRDGARMVDRAENVLREALKALPARSAQRGRLQGLVGSALAQRFRHVGFLPDLFESRHLLGQAVRAAADAGVRAEAWLQLGRVRLEGWHRAGAPVLGEALQAYESAEREAREAYGDEPGSVTAARARHGCGAVFVLLGRPSAARASYRAAQDQWQRLGGALREVDWQDVELTRRRVAELDAEPASPPAGSGLPEEAWRRMAPPWYAWAQSWPDLVDVDLS
ncbi:tetratricopeptide repeat protein [Streptomyces sp. TRM68367]|uniref:tetratricopeptide repeat protein n=1 Tax=Streptomyces sp. TRM68367 TaxID=2758415 RepID=UPI00165C9C8D|nr:tetratricopeptide repeat protein [Streptomyces sp. TRM68367]MBC9725321.1 tetratricopeptide repeat protein [Streptomyces sp. TRM68367]